jgi:hypothetical protein
VRRIRCCPSCSGKLHEDEGQGRDKAPPEQYRRAIEQYFAQISKSVAEQEQAQ